MILNTDKLMLASDGDLIAWRPQRVLRRCYSLHHIHITNTHQLRATLRAGARTDLGVYPLYLLAADGEALCFDCVRKNYREVSAAVREHDESGWHVIGCEVNYEDDIACAHCYRDITPAYGVFED
jgi:uncharacterized protein (DUF58 family)